MAQTMLPIPGASAMNPTRPRANAAPTQPSGPSRWVGGRRVHPQECCWSTAKGGEESEGCAHAHGCGCAHAHPARAQRAPDTEMEVRQPPRPRQMGSRRARQTGTPLHQHTAPKGYQCYHPQCQAASRGGVKTARPCHAPSGAASGAAGSHLRLWQPSYSWRPQPAAPQCRHRQAPTCSALLQDKRQRH